MTIKLDDFKFILDKLSDKYDISKEWIIRNSVYLMYMLCDGVSIHQVDAESILLSDDIAFKGFNKWIK